MASSVRPPPRPLPPPARSRRRSPYDHLDTLSASSSHSRSSAAPSPSWLSLNTSTFNQLVFSSSPFCRSNLPRVPTPPSGQSPPPPLLYRIALRKLVVTVLRFLVVVLFVDCSFLLDFLHIPACSFSLRNAGRDSNSRLYPFETNQRAEEKTGGLERRGKDGWRAGEVLLAGRGSGDG
jgi:hypothetical protein